MTTPNEPLQQHETHIDNDVRRRAETLEEVLAYSGDKTNQKYVELKTRAQQALDNVKTLVSQTSYLYYYLKARKAVSAANNYVQKKSLAQRWHRRTYRANRGAAVGPPVTMA